MTADNPNNQFNQLVEQTLTERKIQIETVEVIDESAKSQVFFQNSKSNMAERSIPQQELNLEIF